MVPAISIPKLVNINQNIEPPNAGVRFKFKTGRNQTNTAAHPYAACRPPFKSNTAISATKALTGALKVMRACLDRSRCLCRLSAATLLAPIAKEQ
jgi:hypothetical protein